MRDEKTHLKAQADRCRRLARQTLDEVTRAELIAMAADYEARALRLNEPPGDQG
jgi:hypothetical protein